MGIRNCIIFTTPGRILVDTPVEYYDSYNKYRVVAGNYSMSLYNIMTPTHIMSVVCFETLCDLNVPANKREVDYTGGNMRLPRISGDKTVPLPCNNGYIDFVKAMPDAIKTLCDWSKSVKESRR
jgi:hypothetical protein